MPWYKILCISDKIDPLIYSNNIKDRFKGIDLILSAGDLELDYYGFIVSSLNKPLLFVFGNHNLKKLPVYKSIGNNLITRGTDYTQSLTSPSYGSIYTGDKVTKVKSIIVAGLGGSMKYNGGPNQYSEFEMTLKILKLVPKMLWNRIVRGRWLDILLSHSPPHGLGDREDRCHQGFRIFNTFLKLFKPKYHLHGHIHLYDKNAERVLLYDETKIINVFESQIIEIEVP